MGDDPRRLALTRQAVAGLPREVAEQDVDLEVLLERLALEEGGLERVAQRADRIGEHVVEHRRGGYWRSPTRPSAADG